MIIGRVAVRDWRATHAGRVHGISFRPRRASEPPGTDRITVERHRFSHARPAAAPTAPITLSLLAHAACLLAFALLLPSHMVLPDIAGATHFAMVFEAAPAAIPAVPAVPAATPATVPTPPELTLEATPTNAPPPVPPPPARPRTALAPVPVPPPVRTTVAPLPAPPVHLARALPKAAAPPTRTPPVERQVALRPPSEPARQFASLTPPPAPAEVPSVEVAAARPVASGPLTPPRPIAGMATNRAPTYPEIALRRDEQGRVMLRVSVSADGTPLQVEVARTSGYPSLDAAALSAVRQWRFVPATQAGIAVAAIAEVPVRFRIEN
jgi:protein TonB